MPNLPPFSTHAIRRYYDQNTRLFLALGSSPRAFTIHRSVWAPGIRTLDEALDYTNGLILAEVEALSQGLDCLRMADLGCGVGGTLFSLLPRLPLPALALGLTISPVQARLARQHAARLGMEKQVHFVEGDFLHPPLPATMNLAWSVEAFLHAENPAIYFTAAAGLLEPGGRLILCDDFLAEPGLSPQAEPVQPSSVGSHQGMTSSRPPAGNHASKQRWVDAYRQGWHVPGLVTVSFALELAARNGLRLLRNLDLTPHLRLRALPDGIARFLLYLGERIPLSHAMLSSMLGSMALQQCLQNGWVRYHYLVFERQ